MLSLFDGVGTARFALQELLERLGFAHVLKAAHFVEIDEELGKATETLWATFAAEKGLVPYQWLARNVWDLVRNEGKVLTDYAHRLPTGALLLLPAGSPCQQLTRLGPCKGVRGLCGEDSSLFFVLPVIIQILQECRPDLLIVVILENAGSMQQHHKDAIIEILGIPIQTWAQAIDAGAWSGCSRARIFFAPIPISKGPPPFSRRSDIWEAGWAPKTNRMPSAGFLTYICCLWLQMGVGAFS